MDPVGRLTVSMRGGCEGDQNGLVWLLFVGGAQPELISGQEMRQVPAAVRMMLRGNDHR